MLKGKIYPDESKICLDYRTGSMIRQITTHRSTHHQPFFMIPAYDNAMQHLIFISHRTGSPQIFAEIKETRQLLQLTDRDDLSEWSVHPSRDGKYIYFVAGVGAWRIDMSSLKEELLVEFSSSKLKQEGMIAAALGTTALSWDDRWWAIHHHKSNRAHLVIIDTTTGNYQTILERDTISHMQFCPDDNNILFYAGSLKDRVWLIQRDGTENRRLYKRNEEKREWITHESWIPGTKELAIIDWPHGIRCIHVETGTERKVTSFNAWHAICNAKGTMMVADTNFPDLGLQIFDPLDGVGDPKTLCYPEASSLGEHWDGPFPYDNGPVNVYAPQHTHPHPSFSPDDRYVVYTSDRSGFSQVYEIEINS